MMNFEKANPNLAYNAIPASEAVFDGRDPEAHGFNTSVDELPEGYFTSRYFLGSVAAVVLAHGTGAAGFAFIGPILTQINLDVGPDPSIIWLALVNTLCLAVGLLLVGRISDLVGRRWFFVGGSFLGLIGSIVCATANTIPVLIGGQVLISISACSGFSFMTTLGELVPVEKRFIVMGSMAFSGVPTVGLGAGIATAFVLYTGPGWRWCYWVLAIMNGVCTALWALFYYPPSFHAKRKNQKRLDAMANFDYVGTVLFVVGLVLFLMGLTWGGLLYPWRSAHVIAAVTVGLLCLIALSFWETRPGVKEPIIPIHLLKNKDYLIVVIFIGFGASVYYTFGVVWPQMVTIVYDSGSPMRNGWISCTLGLGGMIGLMAGGFLAKMIGRVKYQSVTCMVVSGVALSCAATCTPDNRNTITALVCISSLAIGWNEAITLALSTMLIPDQQEIGAAAGTAGSFRSLVSTIAATIYQVVLSAKLKQTIPSVVPQAVTEAGLPMSSVASFIEAFATGSSQALADVKGLTPDILAVGKRAFQVAYSDAYRTVFLTSIAFSVIAIGLSLFVPNVDNLMTLDVATCLQVKGSEEIISRNQEQAHARLAVRGHEDTVGSQ